MAPRTERRHSSGPRHASVNLDRHLPTTSGAHRAPGSSRHAVRSGVVGGVVAVMTATAVIGLVSSTAPSADAATAATMSLAPVADTYVGSGAPNRARGSAVRIQASAKPGSHRYALIRFSVPTLSRRILAARLVVTRGYHRLDSVVYANRVRTSSWREMATTYRTAPRAGAVIDKRSTGRSTRSVRFNVSSVVRSNAKVTIALTSRSRTKFASFRSREWGRAGPKLVLSLGAVQHRATCVGNAMGIPSSSAYVGAAVGGTESIANLEAQTGRPLAIHRTYYNANQVAYAISRVKDDLAHKRLPWISFKLPYSWADMAAGRGDTWAINLVKGLAKIAGPVWLAFHHEPEGDGNLSDWTAMQRHLAPIVHEYSSNVAFTTILIAWDSFYGPPSESLSHLWPGNGVVDIAGWDMYNNYGTNRGSGRMLDPMRYFPKMEAFAQAHHVHWAIAETGYTNQAALAAPHWLQNEYNDLVSQGGLALSYFDSSYNSIADWTLDTPIKIDEFTKLLKGSPRIC